METKKITGQDGGRKTQVVTPFGTAPIPSAPSLKQTGYDGVMLKDRYLVEGELGRGGIGVVYLARDTQLMNRRVVVKVLLEDSTNALHNPWFKKKFEQEIEALVRLDHPGIVGVLDAGTMPDGKEFFVMQYVEGGPLRKLVNGQMDFAQVARIVRQIGQALSAAHDKGIVHRDLKPENIMVQEVSDNEEMIKLIDFGIASVKDSQVATSAEKTKVAGALPYMAPEQLRGQPDASSDIWALGAMAYEMLTGRLPFYAETLVQLYELQKRGVQASPRSLRSEISPTVENILLRSMAFEPGERHLRAKDLGEELARALTGEEKTPTGAQSLEQASSPGITSPISNATSESPAYGTMMTHSARTEVGGEIKDHSPLAAKPKSSIGKIIAAVAAVAVIAVAIWLAIGKTKTVPPPSTARQLNYSVRVRLNPEKNPGKPPLAFPGEIVFNPGDELCLDLNSPQEGFFYLISEDPETRNGLPLYNILFPDPSLGSSMTLRANQQLSLPSPQPPWFPIDKAVGNESLWLIWSDHSIGELESVRKWLNPSDRGEIKDTNQIRAIQQLIESSYSTAKPVAEKDESRTSVKGGKDGLMIHRVKLAHT